MMTSARSSPSPTTFTASRAPRAPHALAHIHVPGARTTHKAELLPRTASKDARSRALGSTQSSESSQIAESGIWVTETREDRPRRHIWS
jgi:hypothetical protein